MDVRDYRKQYAAEVAAKQPARAAGAKAPRRPAVRELVAEMTNRRFGSARRVRAVDRASDGAVRSPTIIRAFLTLLADADENDEVRKAALAALAENSFSMAGFRRYVPEFHEALRVAVTDEDRELRLRAMDLLALSGDEYAQRLLVEGLRNPRRALVPPQRALQMLGYDMHAEYYPLLREIAANRKQPGLRRSALRLLAADSEATDMFRRIASDKTDDKGARASSAVALQGLDPDAFSEVARAVVLDDDDDDDVRATVLTALSHGPGSADEVVDAKVRSIEEEQPRSRQLRGAARRFRSVQQTPRRGTR